MYKHSKFLAQLCGACKKYNLGACFVWQSENASLLLLDVTEHRRTHQDENKFMFAEEQVRYSPEISESIFPAFR